MISPSYRLALNSLSVESPSMTSKKCALIQASLRHCRWLSRSVPLPISDHENRNQRRADQHDDPGNPVGREHENQDGSGDEGGERHLRQIFGVIFAELVHALHQQMGKVAGALAGDKAGAEGCDLPVSARRAAPA